VSFPKFLPWINIPLLKARIVRVTKIWSGIAAKKAVGSFMVQLSEGKDGGGHT